MKREEPERRCIATGDTQPKAGLIRFVVGPDNEIVPDLAERLPGRGIWVTADRRALDKAAAKGLFARAAKTRVVVPSHLGERVADLAARRVAECIALARKAGQAVAGYEKVKSLLMDDAAVMLFQARDGSDGQKKKLRPPRGEATYIDCLSASELGLAFGRDRVIHAAITAGGIADRCLYEAARLKGLRQ